MVRIPKFGRRSHSLYVLRKSPMRQMREAKWDCFLPLQVLMNLGLQPQKEQPQKAVKQLSTSCFRLHHSLSHHCYFSGRVCRLAFARPCAGRDLSRAVAQMVPSSPSHWSSRREDSTCDPYFCCSHKFNFPLNFYF